MLRFKRPLRNYLLLLLLLSALGLASCKVTRNAQDNGILDGLASQKLLIEAFKKDTGIDAVWVSDTTLLNLVKSWQGSGDYPGVDNWATATIPAGLDLYGGLPGQSEYYSIDQTITDTDTMQVAYWESLQVKAHPEFGYRPNVGIFDLKQKSTVAIAKTLANPQFGSGGAWQIYLEDYKTSLTALDTIILKQ